MNLFGISPLWAISFELKVSLPNIYRGEQERDRRTCNHHRNPTDGNCWYCRLHRNSEWSESLVYRLGRTFVRRLSKTFLQKLVNILICLVTYRWWYPIFTVRILTDHCDVKLGRTEIFCIRIISEVWFQHQEPLLTGHLNSPLKDEKKCPEFTKVKYLCPGSERWFPLTFVNETPLVCCQTGIRPRSELSLKLRRNGRIL